MVRIAVLMVLRSHLLAAASFGRYGGTHELAYARPVCDAIAEDSVTVLDRGYLSAAFLLRIESGRERHWLVRARTDLKMRRLKRFAPGDELVEMDVSREARRADPSLPRTWTARLLRYRRQGFPGAQYDEIKTELLEREEAIRSKKPDGVRQELWGVLLAYNLVRLEIESIACEAKVEPTQISFVEALRLMRDEWAWLSVTSPGAIPKRLEAMRRNVKRYVLPSRRPRRYPRAVKRWA